MQYKQVLHLWPNFTLNQRRKQQRTVRPDECPPAPTSPDSYNHRPSGSAINESDNAAAVCLFSPSYLFFVFSFLSPLFRPPLSAFLLLLLSRSTLSFLHIHQSSVFACFFLVFPSFLLHLWSHMLWTHPMTSFILTQSQYTVNWQMQWMPIDYCFRLNVW